MKVWIDAMTEVLNGFYSYSKRSPHIYLLLSQRIFLNKIEDIKFLATALYVWQIILDRAFQWPNGYEKVFLLDIRNRQIS